MDTIIFRGSTYNIVDAPQEIKYYIAQIAGLREDIRKLEFELDQKIAAKKCFEGYLDEYLQENPELEVCPNGNTNNTTGT